MGGRSGGVPDQRPEPEPEQSDGGEIQAAAEDRAQASRMGEPDRCVRRGEDGLADEECGAADHLADDECAGSEDESFRGDYGAPLGRRTLSLGSCRCRIPS